MGGNDFELKRFLQKWEKASLEKYGEYNVFRFSLEDRDISEVITELLSPPFFGEGKRIFFLENFPPPPPSRPFSQKKKEGFEELKNALLDLSDDAVAVCATPKPDKRTAVYKALSKVVAKTYDFPAFERDRSGALSAEGLSQATDFVRSEVEKRKGAILPAAARFLVTFCGADSWKLDREIDKLLSLSLAQEKPISERDIEQVCLPSDEMMNFAFSNAVQSGQVQKILQVFHQLLDGGEAPQAVLGRDLIPTFRQLFQIKLLLESKGSPADIGLHPFVFSKMKSLAGKFSKKALQEMHSELGRIDVALKTGGIVVSPGKNDLFALAVERAILKLFS